MQMIFVVKSPLVFPFLEDEVDFYNLYKNLFLCKKVGSNNCVSVCCTALEENLTESSHVVVDQFLNVRCFFDKDPVVLKP